MAAHKAKSNGLSFQRNFTRDDISPFDMFEYDNRSRRDPQHHRRHCFEMNHVEVPNSWSQVATDILAQKYFRKAGVPQKDGSTGSETSINRWLIAWPTAGNNGERSTVTSPLPRTHRSL